MPPLFPDLLLNGYIPCQISLVSSKEPCPILPHTPGTSSGQSSSSWSPTHGSANGILAYCSVLSNMLQTREYTPSLPSGHYDTATIFQMFFQNKVHVPYLYLSAFSCGCRILSLVCLVSSKNPYGPVPSPTLSGQTVAMEPLQHIFLVSSPELSTTVPPPVSNGCLWMHREHISNA